MRWRYSALLLAIGAHAFVDALYSHWTAVVMFVPMLVLLYLIILDERADVAQRILKGIERVAEAVHENAEEEDEPRHVHVPLLSLCCPTCMSLLSPDGTCERCSAKGELH